MNLSDRTLLFRREPTRVAMRPMKTGPPSEAANVREYRVEIGRITPLPEEADWVQRAKNGEVAAFDWLMTRYRDRVVRLATHILRNPTEAEDLAQEAFLRAFWQLRAFRGDSGFYTWLYRIVVRLCLNHRRSPWWSRETLPSLPDDFFDHNEPTVAATTETRLLIENLLDRLTPPLRAALTLREIEGLEYAEIAEVLEIPVGTVRSRLNAARAQFRELWQRAQEEAGNV